ncbi:TetR/AcrR family transcriptional regulator [Nakamurella lactea]|uniref:TetR/AcrR family transcriptional regulator n=1 Tax=Nakamurella lactea TaxID=459515 RepID=UPI000415B121|nr:TetR/AcrR family transcriptional regulator C-terminal domain-containing protein [Nakamurella lactea]
MVSGTSTKRSNARGARRAVAAPELSRESLIDHALDLADREGLDAVAIRRIATDFGVTPMALYWHVKNKDELLDAMGDRIFQSLSIPPAGADWLDQVRAALVSLVDVLRRHPGSVDLAMARVLLSPEGQLLAERTLGALRGAGFSVRQAADLARQALFTAVMLVQGRPGAEIDTHEDERAAKTAAKTAAIAGLSTAQFPNLVDCAEALTNCDDEDAYYGGGIDLYVAGVEELHRKAAR